MSKPTAASARASPRIGSATKNDRHAKTVPEVQEVTEQQDVAETPVGNSPTDSRLMQAIAEGDQQAFNTLLDEYIHKVHHFVLRMTNQPGDTDDIVQEVFLRAWRNAERFSEQKAGVATWLMSIARNLCIDQHRRHSARPAGHAVPDGQSVIDTLTDNRPHNLDKDRRLERLRAAIADLPERQRTAITLCQLQGFSNAYAAEVLDIKVPAVESLLARARRALRAALTTSDPVNHS